MSKINLDQLEKLADNAWQMFGHWFNAHQIADGITDPDVAALISAMTPATVLGLIERVRKAEEPAESAEAPSPVGGGADLSAKILSLSVYDVAEECRDSDGRDGLQFTREFEAIRAALAAVRPAPTDGHKNLHRLLCERFDYVHDEKDWSRDELSLIEHIAALVAGVRPAQAEEALPHGHRQDGYLMANARRLAHAPITRIMRMPNWQLASELFATGSNSAYEICRRAGIDPDATTIDRAALSHPQHGGGKNG